MKIYWAMIKSSVRDELHSSGIKNPSIRINALDRIEELLKLYFKKHYLNPETLLGIDKNELKSKLARYKKTGSLSGAESSVINNIYEYLYTHIANTEEKMETIKTESKPNKVIVPQIVETESFKAPNEDFNKYNQELCVLQKMFGLQNIDDKLERLKEIYSKSEEFWEGQLKYLPKGGIKYLFIAESPPWSTGDVTYIYNPNSEARTLLKAFSKTFLNEILSSSDDNTELLKMLTGLGLLVIDSIPFAMDYSSKRRTKNYQELVNLTTKSYLLRKINRKYLKWSPELKIAFGFKCNALSIINALKGKLLIEQLNKEFIVTKKMISADNAGYPRAGILRDIYHLEQKALEK